MQSSWSRSNLCARSPKRIFAHHLCEEYACSGGILSRPMWRFLAAEQSKIGSLINGAFYLITRSPSERSLAALVIGVLHFFLADNPERTRFVPEIVKSGEELNDIHRLPRFEEARVSRNRLLFMIHAYTVQPL